jgi:hypothetical protein
MPGGGVVRHGDKFDSLVLNQELTGSLKAYANGDLSGAITGEQVAGRFAAGEHRRNAAQNSRFRNAKLALAARMLE